MVNYKGSIIANPQGDAWEFAYKIYKNLENREKNAFELNKLFVKKFRDGEIKPRIEKNVRGKNCFFIHDSNLNPAYWHLELCLVNDALKNSSAHEIIDVLPYLKFGRQDRKDESRVPITTRVIAKSIDMYDHIRVLTLEVHNPSTQGNYDCPFDSLYSFPTVISYLRKNHPEILEDIVVATPDEGGVKRARAFANRLGNPNIAIGSKFRERAGEVGKLDFSGDVSDKNVLIIDDLIDSGDTSIEAFRKLKSKGANKIYAYATHGLFTDGYEKFTETFDKLFVGDTIKQPYMKDRYRDKESGEIKLPDYYPDIIEVISFAPLFAEAIYRISRGESLSELFD